MVGCWWVDGCSIDPPFFGYFKEEVRPTVQRRTNNNQQSTINH